MSNSILKSTPNSYPHPPQRNLGYRIDKSDEAVRKALTRAIDLLKRMRWLGAEIRVWAAHIETDIKQKLESIKYPDAGKNEKFQTEKKVIELSELESYILHTVRRYMSESNDLMNQLKTLNPPLTSEHIKPFLNPMLKDREATLSALNLLTRSIDELASLKFRLRQGRFPILSYSPAP
jgi:hypothetical protein